MSITNLTPKDLIDFENGIAELFHAGKIPYPIHFSGGNEEQLVRTFKEISPEDWVFSTWRSHYHALLKGIPADELRKKILAGQGMHIMDKERRFVASSIVGGCCAMATGVALSIKRRHGREIVVCFVGDGAEDQGAFYEAVRYTEAFKLPCQFIIEDNDLAVDTTKLERINNYCLPWPGCVLRYTYKRKYPHCQTGVHVAAYDNDQGYM